MHEFVIQRGVNIGGWLSQSKRTDAEREARFTRDDIQFIKEYGFDHIRIPVDEEYFWDEKLNPHSFGWTLLDRCLDWCEDFGLRVIVDLHILRSHYFNASQRPLFTDPEAPKRLALIWKSLAEFLGRRGADLLAYELLNEPVADDHEDWNRVYPYPYRAIREREPDRIIILGSNRWNQAATFPALRIPPADRNLILTFHYYNSMLITHYRAHFVKGCAAYDGPIAYPGKPVPDAVFSSLRPEVQELIGQWNTHYDRSVMEEELAGPLAVREKTGIPLYCGEFGVIGNAPAEIRRAWARDFGAVLDKHAIAWAPWNYCERRPSGFTLFDEQRVPSTFTEGLMGDS